MNYDYIITGSGCAGLSLLYRILKDEILSAKKILVIDKTTKNTNDRTWCYWEHGEGLFEPIVAHKWTQLEFLTSDFSKRFELDHYKYKMIKGIDFYNHVMNFSKDFKNVTFTCETITAIDVKNDVGMVTTEKSNYTATYIFNSTTLFYPEMTKENSLLQHFEGWVIKTKEASFNDKVGTLMDFTLSQKHGATFMYVLPTTNNEALIEYTLFSEEVLDKELYEIAIKDYIKKNLKIKEYTILHKEVGIIPMSLARFSRNPNSKKQVINIGTAGGFTKASSGYTFQFIQKNTKDIVVNLSRGNYPNNKIKFRDKMFDWYDRTLLEVLISKKLTGKEIFSSLFKKTDPEKILAFLDNDSSLIDELKIMNSLPKIPFIKAGLTQLK